MPTYRSVACVMVALSCLASASAMLGNNLRANPASSQGGFKAVVFDFDCTFSQEHLWKTTHNTQSQNAWMQKYRDALSKNEFQLAEGGKPVWKSSSFDSWIMGGSARIAMLKKYFEAWKASGISVEICTWSEPDRVDDVLKGTGLYDLVTAVHGKTAAGNLVRRETAQATYENRGQESKQQWLTVRAAELEGRILFVDDTAANYNGLPSSVEAYRDPNLVKDGPGLTQDMMEALSQTLGAPAGGNVPPPVPPRSAVSVAGGKCCCGFYRADKQNMGLVKGYAGGCNANGKPTEECMQALLQTRIRENDIPMSFHAQGPRCSSEESQQHSITLVTQHSKCCCGKLDERLLATMVPKYKGQCHWNQDTTEQCNTAVSQLSSPLKDNDVAVEVRHWGTNSCRNAQGDVELAAMAKINRGLKKF